MKSSNKIKAKIKLKIKSLIFTNSLFSLIKKIIFSKRLYTWYSLNSPSPSPHFVKQAILKRHSIKNSDWVETGTNKGDTTNFLSTFSPNVYTIEPSKECFELAKFNTKSKKNIFIYNQTSEECLDRICTKLNKKVSFWLDAHYSDQTTFRGKVETPVKEELAIIEKNLYRFEEVVVLIDDIRLSYIDSENYPKVDYFINWAKSNNFNWLIEQDIFIAKSPPLDIYG